MAKATRAAESAALLLNAGDLDGACNRAYYAMFDAARAALLAAGVQMGAEIPRSHGGVISAFRLLLVKPGRVSLELGRSLNRAEEIRLVADYKGETVRWTRNTPPGRLLKRLLLFRRCGRRLTEMRPASKNEPCACVRYIDRPLPRGRGRRPDVV
jgi:uncharacterized protein (UPF0332 family)